MLEVVAARRKFIFEKCGDQYTVLSYSSWNHGKTGIRCNACAEEFEINHLLVIRCTNRQCEQSKWLSELENIAWLKANTKTYDSVDTVVKGKRRFFRLRCIHGKDEERSIIVMKRRNTVDCKCVTNDKRVETCLLKYGCNNVMQDPAIAKRAHEHAYNLKDYTFPSGKVVQIQGYENRMLDILLEKNDEDAIIVGSNVQTFRYTKPDGKEGTFYPDAQIGNIICETKSFFTYFLHQEKTEAKMKAVANHRDNYTMLLYIFPDHGSGHTLKVYKPNGEVWITHK